MVRKAWRQAEKDGDRGRSWLKQRTGSRARLKALKVQPQGQTSSNKVTPPKLHNMHTEATNWNQVFKFMSLWRPFLIRMTTDTEHQSQCRTGAPSIRQVKWLQALVHIPSSWAHGQLHCSFLTKTLPLPERREAPQSQEANKTFNSLKANAYNIRKVIHQ